MIKILPSVILVYSIGACADMSLYVGPSLGFTSYNPSSGAASRETVGSYGFETFLVWKKFMAGANYTYYNVSTQGSATISVSQDNYWGDFDLKYRLFEEDISPYFTLGGGPLVQSVSTTVLGVAESSQQTFFVQTIGTGIVGRIFDILGFNLSLKYYQYSNVNGFNYSISLGYFPQL